MVRLKAILAAAAVAIVEAASAGAAPVILGNYYEETISQLPNLAFVYAMVPAGQVLLIKHVSCKFKISNTSVRVTDITISVNNNTSRLYTIPAVTPEAGISVAEGSPDFLVYSGKRPQINYGIYGASTSEAVCTIIGKLIPNESTAIFD